MTLTIEEIAKTKKLLVVSDFDGTIAGFSKDAYNVPINQKSLKAVKTSPNKQTLMLSFCRDVTWRD